MHTAHGMINNVVKKNDFTSLSFFTCSIKVSLLLSSFVIVIGKTALSQPFQCDNACGLYFFQSTGGNGSLSYITGYTTSTPTVTPLFTMPTNIHNGLAANPLDGYLYYLNGSFLVRLNASGGITAICSIPANLYGCFDNQGRYWTIDAGNNLRAYNIATCTVVKGPYAVPGGGMLDIVFNPYDSKLYFGTVRCDTNGVIDSSYPGTTITGGGAAIGSDGNLYSLGGFSGTGSLFMMNLSTNTSSTVSSFSPGPTTAQSDMASFICTSTSCTVVLPVSLLYFKTTCNGFGVLCEWQTASETNNDYFTIERTSNGIDYETIGIVDGAGNSNSIKNYSFVDHSLFETNSGFVYYRLKQTDFNGDYQYSDIVSADCNNNDLNIINVFPNPAENSIYYNINVSSDVLVTIKITDALGRCVLSQSYSMEEGYAQKELDVSSLSSGAYLLLISSDNGFGFSYEKIIIK